MATFYWSHWFLPPWAMDALDFEIAILINKKLALFKKIMEKLGFLRCGGGLELTIIEKAGPL